MLSTLSSKIIALLIVLLIVLIGVFTAFFVINKGQIALLNANLDKSELSRSELQKNLSSVTSSLESAEKDKQTLLGNLALLAKALSDRERSRNEIKREFEQSTKELTQVFERSSDEKTLTWGATDIPDAVNSVLEQSARCSNRYRNQDSVCFSAQGTDQSVHRSAVFQQEKPRSF
ncbi:hypothetical protein [Shewanella xiamenensis]|uniref:hypothetical protein n=1 Tax=Shewanella xiamenensis TaxID=332186 RepID=UPI00313D0A47